MKFRNGGARRVASPDHFLAHYPAPADQGQTEQAVRSAFEADHPEQARLLDAIMSSIAHISGADNTVPMLERMQEDIILDAQTLANAVQPPESVHTLLESMHTIIGADRVHQSKVIKPVAQVVRRGSYGLYGHPSERGSVIVEELYKTQPNGEIALTVFLHNETSGNELLKALLD